MSTKYSSYIGQATLIDLSSEKVSNYSISDEDRDLFLGNKSLAAKILFDELKPGIDPLSPENILIVSTSVLTGTGAPCSGRFNVSTKGPLTGVILSSNCGGNFGVDLKKAGHDVLIVRGRAQKPVYILIEDGKIEIKDATHLWGMDTERVQEELESIHGRNYGKLVIGPAGENIVRYACMISGERAVGRGGVGAVSGSKYLKAIVVKGTRKITIHDDVKFKKAIKDWSKLLKSHPMTGGRLPKFGTAGLLNLANEKNVLPTENFSGGVFEYAGDISGETLTEKHLVKNSACRFCPIRCGRVVEVDGKQVKGPEFETIGMFGSNIKNKSLEFINRWNVVMDKLGIDSISTGGAIAFAMEATQKGLMNTDLKFEKTDNIETWINDIAYRRGMGNELAEGVLRMAEKFGGMEFAMQSKGLEFAAYEPRGAVGQGLGYATANRGGCHLNAGYLVYFEALGPINLPSQSSFRKEVFTRFQQDMFEAVSACGTCIFTTYAVLPGFFNKIPNSGILRNIIGRISLLTSPLLRLLFKIPSKFIPLNLSLLPYTNVISLASGQKMSIGKFFEIGARGFNLERMFNVREGMILDELPKRLTDDLQNSNKDDSKVPLSVMLPKYYKLRGWDKRGVPTIATLKKLKLNFAIDSVVENSSKENMLQEFDSLRKRYEPLQAKFIALQVSKNKEGV